MRTYLTILFFLLWAIVAPQPVQGFGANVTGGAGQPVFTVTNLNSSGAGSFTAALGNNRQIRFSVAGTIQFRLLQTLSNVTIDGSTAPAPGITLNNNNNGDCFSLDGPACKNVIVKYLRFRNAGGDGFNIVNGANNIVFDHCSSSGNRDGNGDITSGSFGVTVQYCLFGSGGPNWSGSMLVAYAGTNNITVHHCLFTPATGTSNGGEVGERNPAVHSSGTGPRNDLMIDFRNNVVYRWGRDNGTGSGYGSGVDFNGSMQVINNYYYSNADPSRAIVTDFDPTGGSGGMAYASGNFSGNGNAINNVSNHAAYLIPGYAQVITQDPCSAAQIVLQNAGCRPLDAIDNAFINSVSLTGCHVTFPIMITQFFYTGRGNYLTWITTTENNLDRFEVQESSDGINFKTIARVNSKGIDGTSNIEQTYTYQL